MPRLTAAENRQIAADARIAAAARALRAWIDADLCPDPACREARLREARRLTREAVDAGVLREGLGVAAMLDGPGAAP